MFLKSRKSLVRYGLVLTLCLAPVATAAPAATEIQQDPVDEVGWQWPSWLNSIIDFVLGPVLPDLMTRDGEPAGSVGATTGLDGNGVVIDPNGIPIENPINTSGGEPPPQTSL